MVLVKKSGLPTTTPDLQPLVQQELQAFDRFLSERFGAGMNTPEGRIVEAYIVWKALHEHVEENSASE